MPSRTFGAGHDAGQGSYCGILDQKWQKESATIFGASVTIGLLSDPSTSGMSRTGSGTDQKETRSVPDQPLAVTTGLQDAVSGQP